MPLFEYICRGCGRQFETLVTGSRQAVCPTCSSTDLEKLFSTFAARGSSARTNAAGAAPRFT